MSNNERRALAALLLHVTGNLGKRDGTPYAHRVVREAVEALFPGQPWSEPGVDDVRAVAVDPIDTDGTVLSLIVKGDAAQAQGAASARKIPTVVARVLNRATETVLHAPAEYFDDVAAWFNTDRNEAPFPPGSLLYFTTSPAERARRFRNVEISK